MDVVIDVPDTIQDILKHWQFLSLGSEAKAVEYIILNRDWSKMLINSKDIFYTVLEVKQVENWRKEQAIKVRQSLTNPTNFKDLFFSLFNNL